MSGSGTGFRRHRSRCKVRSRKNKRNEDRQPKGCLFVLFGYELFQEGEVVDVQLAVLVDVGGGPLSKVGIRLIEQPLLEQHGVCDISGSVAVYVAKVPHLIRLDSLAAGICDVSLSCRSIRGYVDGRIAGLCGVDRTVVDRVVSRILYRYNETPQIKRAWSSFAPVPLY